MAFSGRVAGVFGTRLVQLTVTVLATFVLARLLGPEGRGVYTVLMLVPTTLFALAQLGLPSSLVFHAGRGGRLGDLERHTLLLGLAVSAVAVAATFVALPILEATVLRTAPIDLLPIALLVLPIRMVATLAGSVLYGRQRFRVYNLILTGQSVAWLLLVVAIVGGLGLGVAGALWAYVLFTAGGAILVMLELDRLRRRESRSSAGDTHGVTTLEVSGYGLRLYPASVGTFFGYRADVFLLGWLIGSSSEIGIYSVAVSLAELVFNVPDSIGTVLFPRVAAMSRDDADRLAPSMSRVTVLVTAAAAVLLAPVAAVALAVFLPAFLPGIVPLVVILPGIVSLSVAKVLTSYLSGTEQLRPVAVAAIVSLAVNVAANIVLIPTAGITGAAAASLVSYTVYAVLMVRAAAAVSSRPWSEFVVPGASDVGRVATALARLGARLSGRVA